MPLTDSELQNLKEVRRDLRIATTFVDEMIKCSDDTNGGEILVKVACASAYSSCAHRRLLDVIDTVDLSDSEPDES